LVFVVCLDRLDVGFSKQAFCYRVVA